MDKQGVTDALSKSLKDITDAELKAILDVPEPFWPTNPYQHTPESLVAEKLRRYNAAKLQYDEVLKEVLYLSTLRHLVSFGPRVFPEMDLLGIDEATAEIRRLEPIVRKTIKTFKEQK